MKAGPTALDTGFFVCLLQGEPACRKLWAALVEGQEGIVSGLTLVELLRLGLRGAVAREDVDLLLQAIPALCRVVWPDWKTGERAARLSHGLGIPIIDALVLATALEAGAVELWTADTHLLAYQGKELQVKLIRANL